MLLLFFVFSPFCWCGATLRLPVVAASVFLRLPVACVYLLLRQVFSLHLRLPEPFGARADVPVQYVVSSWSKAGLNEQQLVQFVHRLKAKRMGGEDMDGNPLQQPGFLQPMPNVMMGHHHMYSQQRVGL